MIFNFKTTMLVVGIAMSCITVSAQRHMPVCESSSQQERSCVFLQQPSMVRTLTKSEATGYAPFKPAGPVQAPVLKTESGTVIWGNLLYSSAWGSSKKYGEYTFGTVAGSNALAALKANANIKGDGGGAIYDGVYHFVSTESYYGEVNSVYYEYDITSWEKLVDADCYNDHTIIGTATAYAPTDKKVYGCFYDQDMSSYVFGTIDYSAIDEYGEQLPVVTAISQLTYPYMAMAANKRGEIFGFLQDGSLWKIDKADGTQRKIGATGVTPNEKIFGGAVFDPQSNEIYWAVTLKDGSALYKVNAENASAAKVYDFANDEQIVNLYIPQAPISNDAPAPVSNLKLDFAADSKTGNVVFDMPTMTKGGSTLSGTLNYFIIVKGDTIKKGVSSPGIHTIVEVTLNEGENEVGVLTSNDAGMSEAATVTGWIGRDEPMPVTSLKLTIDPVTRNATVSWTAPKKGVHGGAINPDSLSYIIGRNPGMYIVKSNYKDTTFSEILPDSIMAKYFYAVAAVNGHTRGAIAFSDSIAFGKAFEVPCGWEFPTAGSLDFFTTIDANNDGETWSWSHFYKAAQSPSSESVNSDDWLLTPSIHLLPNKLYTISFDARVQNTLFKGKLKAAIGIGNDPASMEPLIPETEINENQYTRFEKQVSVDKEGDYHIAFHDGSDKGNDRIFLDSIRIVGNASLEAPDSVTAITVKPADNGVRKAEVTFTSPTLTVTKKPLDAITKIVLYNDGTPIDSVSNPATGARLTLVDDCAKNGFNKYTVVAYNSAGNGLQNSSQAWVGIDVPATPANIKIEDKHDYIVLSWNRVGRTGIHNGYVDESKVTYDVLQYDGQKYVIVANGLRDNVASFALNTNQGSQDILYLYVQAKNEGGTGKSGISNPLVVGKPYTIPFKESFSNGRAAYDLWWTERKGQYVFSFSASGTQDNDGGCIRWSPAKAGDETWFNTGKIDLKGAKNPKVVFWYWADPGKDALLKVEETNQNSSAACDTVIDFKSLNGQPGWRQAKVSLSEAGKGEYSIIKFHAIANVSDVSMRLDNFKIFDVAEKNLGVSLSAPSSVMAGSDNTITVNVSNDGDENVASYIVRLFVDDKEYAIDTCSNLASMSSKTQKFVIHADAGKKDPVVVYAKVECEGDRVEADNVSSKATITVNIPTYPAVNDLTGDFTGDKVKLRWTRPATENGYERFDDFEEYTPWLTDSIGDWTTYDADKMNNLTIDEWNYPHSGEPAAFIVSNPASDGVDLSKYPSFRAHSGQQYLMSMAAKSLDGMFGNDDWVISPLLSGKTQIISFYAKSVSSNYPETFQILYSLKGNDPHDFITLRSVEGVPQDWTEYTAELPDGAKYFAIRNVSKDKFALFIDDAKFHVGASEILGYNIYCDGKLIGSAGPKDVSYDTDIPTASSATFNVTVIYSAGESDFSNTVSTPTTGIENILLDGKPFDVFDLSGHLLRKAVKSTEGLSPGIYVIKGMKILVK